MSEETTAVEVTVRFILDTVTKMWVWKLTDASGSTIAKSAIQYASEAEAQAAFEDYKNGGESVTPEAVETIAPGLADVAPEEEKVADTEVTAPEATEPTAPEATEPVAPESAPEVAPEEVPAVDGTVAPTEETTDAGTAEVAPAEGVATAE